MVDPELKVLWVNPEFRRLADPRVEPVGGRFYRAFGDPGGRRSRALPVRHGGRDRASPPATVLRIDAQHYLRVTVTPVADPPGRSST